MKKLLLALLAFYMSATAYCQKNRPVQVAFLADVHLQDLYGTFKDTVYPKLINPQNNRPLLMRTMDSQLHSTRIFNENYFAFLAALDDIAKRGVKLVALPGDYSDDGQPIHIRGLVEILHQYSDKYGMRFFITTGNHDPVGPFDTPAGKNDFLGAGGKKQPVYSNVSMHTEDVKTELPTIITNDISTMGYEGITAQLKDFGFYPDSKSLFWATPYSSYDYSNYTYTKALSEATYQTRRYEITSGNNIPDATYITEPVKGLWLLAIDGNVYLPTKNKSSTRAWVEYHGASIGYNNVLQNKVHLIKWVKNMADEAKKRGKVLIAFSHYPMVDYNDGASAEITQLLGERKWQMERLPVDAVAQSFADAGIKIHFAGHMHINDTGVYHGKNGNNLINIQTPSLAAYIPGYKLLTITDATHMEVETITIDELPRFNELFELYKQEHTFLESIGSKDIWDEKILETKSYHEFTEYHLKELVRLRFIPQEWPKEFTDYFTKATGYDLLSKLVAAKELDSTLKKYRLKAEDFKAWTGSDFMVDLYRLQSADCLALKDISKNRMEQYRLIIKLSGREQSGKNEIDIQCGLFYCIFSKLLTGDPAGDFKIDTKTGTVTEIK
ncbi:metallophosphoesterase [Flavobacterium sp. RHBU_24]|uniref:metallophosphoesterase n=1 Tax=Flavobacterium sp. RHBU_24 TaxID=3391185 RepID=UPI003985614F